MRVITEPKELLGRYVARKQGYAARDWGQFVAFGLVNNWDELVAGVVYNSYAPPAISMHIAAERLTPTFVAVIMDYAFRQAQCRRVTGFIEKRNHASRKFARHLGARLEGTMKDASPSGDVCIYGLLRADAEKWLTPRFARKLEVQHG